MKKKYQKQNYNLSILYHTFKFHKQHFKNNTNFEIINAKFIYIQHTPKIHPLNKVYND